MKSQKPKGPLIKSLHSHPVFASILFPANSILPTPLRTLRQPITLCPSATEAVSVTYKYQGPLS